MLEASKETKGNKKENLHAGHRKRVLKNFMELGIDEKSDPHKVLEMILFFTIPRKDTNELAHIVLKYFDNSFVKVMEASVEELIASTQNAPKDIPKIIEYTANHIKLILEIAKFYYTEKSREERRVFSRSTASDFLFKKLTDKTTETVYMLCLDNANRFMACHRIGVGDEFSVMISPRQFVKKITQIGASKVLIAHNHPRGVAFPSSEDINTTKLISIALSGINAKLMDHIIVAENDYVSMRDSADYKHLFMLDY